MEDNACARGASPIVWNPHHDYHRHQRTLEPIFTDIFLIWNARTGKLRVSQIDKLPKSTLYDWKSVWAKDSSWRPWLEGVHGPHHRTFSEEEETELTRTMLSDFITPGRFSNSATFRQMAFEKFAHKTDDLENFACFSRFIHDFRQHHRFTSRRFHVKRRNRVIGRFDIDEWTEEIRQLLFETNHDSGF